MDQHDSEIVWGIIGGTAILVVEHCAFIVDRCYRHDDMIDLFDECDGAE